MVALVTDHPARPSRSLARKATRRMAPDAGRLVPEVGRDRVRLRLPIRVPLETGREHGMLQDADVGFGRVTPAGTVRGRVGQLRNPDEVMVSRSSRGVPQAPAGIGGEHGFPCRCGPVIPLAARRSMSCPAPGGRAAAVQAPSIVGRSQRVGSIGCPGKIVGRCNDVLKVGSVVEAGSEAGQ